MHPHRGGPFYLLMPMNTQPALLPGFNLEELPRGPVPRMGAAADDGAYERAVELILSADRVVVRVGGGARQAGAELVEFLELADAVAVLAPIATGAIPYANPRNMTVGGSKGSISGNYAMENADLLVAVGTRSVCQSDCSRTGYPNAQHVININTDLDGVLHYNRTIALLGDAGPTLARLNGMLAPAARRGRQRRVFRLAGRVLGAASRLGGIQAGALRRSHVARSALGGAVLTQPAAIKIATDWARANGVVSFFDAGDVQANGFQIVEDERPGQTFTETGASYMGFACLGAAGDRPGREAVLCPGLQRRRLLHHEPADPDRRGRARGARLHPPARQPHDGRDCGAAGSAVRIDIRRQRLSGRGLRRLGAGNPRSPGAGWRPHTGLAARRTGASPTPTTG